MEPISYYDFVYHEFMIQRLEAERCKIVQRGRLSEYEHIRLYEIDYEIAHWTRRLSSLHTCASS